MVRFTRVNTYRGYDTDGLDSHCYACKKLSGGEYTLNRMFYGESVELRSLNAE